MINDSEEFFYRECAAHARLMHLTDAIKYLRGMILVCPPSPALNQIKFALDCLHESENQLDLIHSGQLKLDFSKPVKTKANNNK